MIIIQDGKGNELELQSLIANLKQFFCNHRWHKVGFTYECDKCQKVKSDD